MTKHNKLGKSRFRALLLTAIHRATLGKTTEDLDMVIAELEKETQVLRDKLATRAALK